MAELDATLLILITVAAPVGWGEAVEMSAASFWMADMGGSGERTGGGKKLALLQIGAARFGRARASVRGGVIWDVRVGY